MELTINGRKRRVDVPADMPVLWVLPPPIATGTIAAPVAATYRFDQVREAIHESGTERWQSAVHVESVIRLQVV